MPRSRIDSARQFLRSNLLGLVAIFIVLGGTAIALPGKNRVDSGDIKQGAVRTLDLRREAVTKAKLRRNAVDGSRVRNNSLTDDDIAESTLDLDRPLKAGSVGEREEADRERRIAISPGEFLPPEVGAASVNVAQGLQAASFDPDVDQQVAATTMVPVDRAPGSGLRLQLLWDADQTGGDITWNVGFRAAGAGAVVGTDVPEGVDVPTTITAADTVIETAVLDIPAGAVQNGQPLALGIARDADAPSDTSPWPARLRLVEIRYTATG
jgi:hypothetical protein